MLKNDIISSHWILLFPHSSKEDSKPAARKKSNKETPFLVSLYNVVRKLDDSKESQSVSTLLLSNKAWALEAASSAPATAPEGGDGAKLPIDQAYCFALVLVTHVLHRLTVASADGGESDGISSQVLAGWARFLITRMEALI